MYDLCITQRDKNGWYLMILRFFIGQLPYCLVVCITRSVSQQSAGTCSSIHPSLSCFRWSHICLKLLQPLKIISLYTSPVAYLPAVALGGGRGGGALVNGCGDLVDRRGAPLLRAHGAPMVVLVMGHDGHRVAPWTSLSTTPCRCWASSDRFPGSLLAVHLENKVRKSHYCT